MHEDDLRRDLQDEVCQWIRDTFPPNPSLTAVSKHMLKEAGEIEDDPQDRVEYADYYILLVRAERILIEQAAKIGMSYQDLIEEAHKKLAVNKTRTWGAENEDGVIEHVRDSSGN